MGGADRLVVTPDVRTPGERSLDLLKVGLLEVLMVLVRDLTGSTEEVLLSGTGGGGLLADETDIDRFEGKELFLNSSAVGTFLLLSWNDAWNLAGSNTSGGLVSSWLSNLSLVVDWVLSGPAASPDLGPDFGL